MNETQFLKTLVETIKYDDSYAADRDELLGILRNSIITFDKSSNFTRKTWQCYEYIDLRVPIPIINIAKKRQELLSEIASDVYIESADYDFGGLTIKPKIIELEADDEAEHDVIFDDIKDTIIQGIRGAKYVIWAAVAWFSDRDILNELLRKKEAGISIRIITSNEKSNQAILGEIVSNFETVLVPLRGDNLSNRLHDKFCIVDFEYVMHGTYNWSKNAQNNDETLATALDRDFVVKFGDEFQRIYVENK